MIHNSSVQCPSNFNVKSRINFYLQNYKSDHEEKEGSGHLALMGNNLSLCKNPFFPEKNLTSQLPCLLPCTAVNSCAIDMNSSTAQPPLTALGHCGLLFWGHGTRDFWQEFPWGLSSFIHKKRHLGSLVVLRTECQTLSNKHSCVLW